MKAVLEYTNCLQDGKNIFKILANNNIEVLKTRLCTSLYPKIIIRIENYSELMNLVYELNNGSIYGVRVVRTVPCVSILDLIKDFFT